MGFPRGAHACGILFCDLIYLKKLKDKRVIAREDVLLHYRLKRAAILFNYSAHQ